MGDLKQLGIPITLDMERNLIFNFNVIEKCIDKFGAMDDILNAVDLKTVKWIAVQMVNEDAEIWNEQHPDNKKPLLEEEKLGRYVIGIYGLNELQQKVREAMLLGLPANQVQEVEEFEKNLMTARGMDGKMKSLLKRFLNQKEKKEK